MIPFEQTSEIALDILKKQGSRVTQTKSTFSTTPALPPDIHTLGGKCEGESTHLQLNAVKLLCVTEALDYTEAQQLLSGCVQVG